MSDLAKQNENGRKAEHQTQVFLLDHFWVLKFSSDLDGASFLVQPSTRSIESLCLHQGSWPFAFVQSRFYQEGSEAEVSRLLVLQSDRKPQKEYFVSFHSVDRLGAASDYFFSAEEVMSCFKRKTNQTGQDVFVFQITDEKNYSQFRRKSREKALMVSKALSSADLEKNQAYLKLVFQTSSSRSVHPPLVQISGNKWQMRHDQTLFEFERDENEIVHGWKSDTSGTSELTPFIVVGSFGEYEFDPLNEEWIRQIR